MSRFEEIERKIGIQFDNPSLLAQAFTHSSYVNEMRARGKNLRDNERLEFLGDAVLELTVSEFLYRTYEQLPEGEMTKLRAAIVCEPALKAFAEQLDFGSYVYLGKGEEMTGGRHRPSLLADVFEAFIGALYLDKGLPVVVSFLQQWVFPQVVEGRFSHINDFKSRLQEEVQRRNLGLIQYLIAGEKGPAHHRQFVSQVLLNGQLIGTGEGRSKKEAEQAAAAHALEQLGH